MDDPESRGHILILSVLGMAVGCARYAFSRAYFSDGQDILRSRRQPNPVRGVSGRLALLQFNCGIPPLVVKVCWNAFSRIKRAVRIDDTSETVCVRFRIVAA